MVDNHSHSICLLFFFWVETDGIFQHFLHVEMNKPTSFPMHLNCNVALHCLQFMGYPFLPVTKKTTD